METDWQNFFKAEDFKENLHEQITPCLHGVLKSNAEWIAEFANRKLWHAIQTAEKVNGNAATGEYHGVPTLWMVVRLPSTTHEARIVDVKKL